MKLVIKKMTSLYQIPLFYLVLEGVNRVFLPEIHGFVGLEPHPYWLGIILFGFHYGITWGLTAGFISAFSYLAHVWLYSEHYFFSDFSFYLLPSFFIIGGFISGFGVHHWRSLYQQTLQENHFISKKGKTLTSEIQTLTLINRELEKNSVTRTSTLMTLYEGARRFESLHQNQGFGPILEFIALALEAEEIAFYKKINRGWQLAAQFGWRAPLSYPHFLKINEGITGLAGSQEKIISIRDYLGNGSSHLTNLPDDCLLAGPVRQGESGEVIGVIGIQYLPIIKLNSASVNLFSFLLNWSSRAMGQSFYIQSLESNKILDVNYQIYSYPYFQSRSLQEFLRAKRYYLPLSLGLVHIDGLEHLSSQQKHLFLSTIIQLLKECVRDIDVIARYEETNTPLAILFVTTGHKQALEIKDQFLRRYQYLNLGSIKKEFSSTALSMGLSSFTPSINDIGNMIEEAKKDLKHEICRS